MSYAIETITQGDYTISKYADDNGYYINDDMFADNDVSYGLMTFDRYNGNFSWLNGDTRLPSFTLDDVKADIKRFNSILEGLGYGTLADIAKATKATMNNIRFDLYDTENEITTFVSDEAQEIIDVTCHHCYQYTPSEQVNFRTFLANVVIEMLNSESYGMYAHLDNLLTYHCADFIALCWEAAGYKTHSFSIHGHCQGDYWNGVIKSKEALSNESLEQLEYAFSAHVRNDYYKMEVTDGNGDIIDLECPTDYLDTDGEEERVISEIKAELNALAAHRASIVANVPFIEDFNLVN